MATLKVEATRTNLQKIEAAKAVEAKPVDPTDNRPFSSDRPSKITEKVWWGSPKQGQRKRLESLIAKVFPKRGHKREEVEETREIWLAECLANNFYGSLYMGLSSFFSIEEKLKEGGYESAKDGEYLVDLDLCLENIANAKYGDVEYVPIAPTFAVSPNGRNMTIGESTPASEAEAPIVRVAHNDSLKGMLRELLREELKGLLS